jgi:hypothetical protein
MPRTSADGLALGGQRCQQAIGAQASGWHRSDDSASCRPRGGGRRPLAIVIESLRTRQEAYNPEICPVRSVRERIEPGDRRFLGSLAWL